MPLRLLLRCPAPKKWRPMPLIEAMAAGVPIVASATGGLPYLSEDRLTGCLAPAGTPCLVRGRGR